MRFDLILPATALLAANAAAIAVPAAAQDRERALAVERELQRLAGTRVLWPGFDPIAVPLAIYTGERTFLFRHPSPPDGFVAASGSAPTVHVLQGRHPAVTSNSSADIGGAATATLLADGARGHRTPAELAATAIHEAFHVYQRAHHRGWSGNEGDLFLYPSDDARLLALRRLESAALRRALLAAGPAAECWTRLALGIRALRFDSMDSAYSKYERLTELNEGLATYVQLRALGEASIDLPEGGFRATEVRTRTYSIGPALAFLLDRFHPHWQHALVRDDGQHLDAMLGRAVAKGTGAHEECGFSNEEHASIELAAHRDAAAVLVVRGELRAAFDIRPGWRLVIHAADGRPLWPQSFDPLNVERVAGGLLHTRLLHVGNDAGQMRAVAEGGAELAVLTEGLGPHPLFSGVGRVVVAGIARPNVEMEGRTVNIRAAGLDARFTSATVQVNGTVVVVQLEPED